MASLVAVNYAEALFDLAKEEQLLDNMKNDLLVISETIETCKELEQVMKHPKIEKEEKKQILTQIFKDVQLYTSNFLQLLIDKNRFSQIKEICKVYITLYNEYHNIEVAFVQSATELNEQQLQTIKEMLTKKLNKNIEMKVLVNRDLIAGIRIKIKDEVLDNSAATKLDKMKDVVVKTTL